MSEDGRAASSAHGPGKRWDESPRRMGFEARRIWWEERKQEVAEHREDQQQHIECGGSVQQVTQTRGGANRQAHMPLAVSKCPCTCQ